MRSAIASLLALCLLLSGAGPACAQEITFVQGRQMIVPAIGCISRPLAETFANMLFDTGVKKEEREYILSNLSAKRLCVAAMVQLTVDVRVAKITYSQEGKPVYIIKTFAKECQTVVLNGYSPMPLCMTHELFVLSPSDVLHLKI